MAGTTTAPARSAVMVEKAASTSSIPRTIATNRHPYVADRDKGIPIIFFFSGLHPDYHQVTDTVDKIDFDKMARIGQLVYEIGRRVANQDRAPVRDFKGPRAGIGATGKLSTN